MAYDSDQADRIRSAVQARGTVTEKEMFGGLAFLVNGNMAVAVSGQGGLLLRVDPGEIDALVVTAGVTRAEMRGRALKGWVRVDPSVVASEEALGRWVQVGTAYAASLPSK